MAVNVYGPVNGTAPKLCLDVFDILALLDKHARVGVPQVMKPDPWELCSN
jgi:hypothetical protein